jgi:hypothetical protein
MRLGQKRLIKALMAIVGLVSLLQAPAESAASCPGGSDPLIVVERLQGGVAGQTGERTSIGEDGCFTVDQLLDGKVISRLRSGRLGPDRLLSARAAIEAAGIASLPDRAGNPPMVNPAFVSVTYGGVTKVAVAPAGASLEDVGALGRGSAEDPAARLARLAARLLELTGS